MKLHACEDTAASGDIPARWRSRECSGSRPLQNCYPAMTAALQEKRRIGS